MIVALGDGGQQIAQSDPGWLPREPNLSPGVERRHLAGRSASSVTTTGR